jgi:Na+-translocating ferredoxin:NAD+ oxidoreductase RNF subunit RnfB
VNDIIIYAVVSLSLIGAIAAIILYFIAQKFKVLEDPKIDELEEVLPAANCGGCGFPGCRGFAEALVKSANDNQSIEGFNCPVGGNDVMAASAAILGLVAEEKEPQIAVIRCSGSHENAPKKINYDGPATCTFAHNLSSGESGCPYGCLGCGDCVTACDFDAIYMDELTGLPIVKDNCVACGACVLACPRNIIELRNKGKKDRRIFVSCINEEKGGQSKKNCKVACIGCSKCFKVCSFEAITMNNNLAYIDYEKCKLCRKCVIECPTGAIHELNFPPRKEKKETAPKTEAKLESKVEEKASPSVKASENKKSNKE